jgi:phosphopantothenoylcysteine synthetase/decarboxylase
MNVVVTGGGTVAPIDDVRQIANVSTGRFSAMITEACLSRGATVWHIHTPTALLPFARDARFNLAIDDPDAEQARLGRLHREWRAVRDRLHLVPLARGTVADYAENLERILRSRPVDIAFLAMAVSDFEPEPFGGKLDSQLETLVIRGRRTPKVIRSVRDWAPGIFLVGFKLLSHVGVAELIRQAEAACRINRADLTVANDLQTVRSGCHTIHLVRPGHPTETFGPGDDPAEQLVARAFAWSAPVAATPGPSRLSAEDDGRAG